MKEDEIQEPEKGYYVLPDEQEVDRVRKLIGETLWKADISTGTALTALCISSIETAYYSNVNKPHFLRNLSNWWEDLDSQEQQEEEYGMDKR